MKNKFEALTAFQSWPEDWQRLCAEYWAENDKPASVHVSLHPAWEALHKSNATAVDESLAIKSKQANAPINASQERNEKPKQKRNPCQPWTISQQEYLARCAAECDTQIAACRMFLRKFPGREIGAVQIRYYLMSKQNWKINY